MEFSLLHLGNLLCYILNVNVNVNDFLQLKTTFYGRRFRGINLLCLFPSLLIYDHFYQLREKM